MYSSDKPFDERSPDQQIRRRHAAERNPGNGERDRYHENLCHVDFLFYFISCKIINVIVPVNDE